MVAINSIDLSRGVAAIALLVLTACGGGGGDSGNASAGTSTQAAVTTNAATVATPRPVTLSDIEIAQLLFADDQRTPSTFLKDPAPSYPGYVATSHLKNTDQTGASTGPQYELCTDDWSVALSWSDETAAALAATTLVETNVNDRFHEFIRVRPGTPQGYLRTRIYKCSYLDRSASDLRSQSSTAGSFNKKPMDAEAIRQLSEYLWQFTSYNNYGNAVLKSSGSSTSVGFKHTVIVAQFAGAANGCDRVNVVGWSHSVNAQTGELTRTTETLWEYGTRRSAGVVELCNPF